MQKTPLEGKGMSIMKSSIWLAMILLANFLTACGGGGGSDDPVVPDSADTTSITSGIAVDPYIFNAQFDEIDAEGNIIQSSDFSDASGRFSFTNAISDGSVLQIRSSLTAPQGQQAQHGGEHYTGIIKRQVFVGDEDPVVVSPLTTLLANGMTPDEVIQMIRDAGLGDLSESSLYADPMAALTVSDLVLLQANMAINAFMEATQNFDYPGNADGVSPSPATSVSFAAIADMVTESLDETRFQQMVSVYGPDFTVGDMANTAVKVNHAMIQEMVNSGSQTVPMPTLDRMLTIADVNHTRMGGGTTPPDTGTGGGTTPPANTPDGQTIFAANCSGCHTVGASTGVMDLAGDGAKVTTKFGSGISHNGNTLAADEITAVAAYFGSTGGTTPPGTGGGATPPTVECGSCHSLPPTGDTAGAHAVHTVLNGIDNTCVNCHADAIHQDGWVDLGFAAKWDAKSGAATDNGDGTCSSISCHGGQTTPDWATGSINVDTQCQSCHANGTSQYNSYSSGEHNKHVNSEGFACTECHDSAKLAVGHFSDLSTPGFEQPAAATLKSSLNYNSQNCTISCHGKNHNSEQW